MKYCFVNIYLLFIERQQQVIGFIFLKSLIFICALCVKDIVE